MSFADALVRRTWTLQRFGLTPQKLLARVRNREEPAILCVSLPKAGTHLLERALCLHPHLYRRVVPTLHDKNINRWGGLERLLERLHPGQILVSHLHFRPEYPHLLARTGVRCLFLVRDPRDILVSQAFYIAGDRGHYLHHLFAPLPDTEARVRVGITGDSVHGLLPLQRRLSAFAGWLNASALVVRYEALIGGMGGGDIAAQHATLGAIYRAVGISPSDALLSSISARLFSRASPTFRKGTTGQWKQHLTPTLLTLLEREAAEELKRYGYGDSAAA